MPRKTSPKKTKEKKTKGLEKKEIINYLKKNIVTRAELQQGLSKMATKKDVNRVINHIDQFAKSNQNLKKELLDLKQKRSFAGPITTGS